MGLFGNLFTQKEKKDFPPVPKWKPDLPINIDLIVDKAKYYTSKKFQFAVFKNGTVVYFPVPVDDMEQSAKATLRKIFYAHPDMKPLVMDDGNYLVQYSQPAFTIVFEEEVERYWNYIDQNHQDGICRDEVLINAEGQANVFDKLGKICLFGRSKMFLDAQHPEIAMTFAAP